MAFLCGYNFRATSTYVTDGGDDLFVDGGDSYPTNGTNGNGQSSTHGWEVGFSSANERNRNSSLDPRVAGVHFESGTTLITFRVDLEEAVDHEVALASGDAASSFWSEFEFLDTTNTTIFTVRDLL